MEQFVHILRLLGELLTMTLFLPHRVELIRHYWFRHRSILNEMDVNVTCCNSNIALNEDAQSTSSISILTLIDWQNLKGIVYREKQFLFCRLNRFRNEETGNSREKRLSFNVKHRLPMI